MSRLMLTGSGLLFLAWVAGCAKSMPAVDLDRLDPAFVKRCTEVTGVVVISDERYLDYKFRGYDNSEYRMFSGDKSTVRRQVLKILSTEGAASAADVRVVHYRERVPDIEVRVWMENGSSRAVNVRAEGTELLADWPCEFHAPRVTRFHVATLVKGDTVEIVSPVSGPDTLLWRFGSDRFCSLRSQTTFGHPADEYRPDLRAKLVDASGAARRTSEGDAYPMVFELDKPLMPLSLGRLPYVLVSPRCPGWSNLRAQLLILPLWMARAGKVTGREAVNPFLASPLKNGERARRIRAVAEWLAKRVALEAPPDHLHWMRWMPVAPAHKAARARKASPGAWTALAFRILEEAGLKPRFVLLHTHKLNPFDEKLPTTSQFDTLAVQVDDETGKTHWLVPGLPYDSDDQPPALLKGRRAFMVERYWADREQGAGDCFPVNAVGFSCQIMTPEPVELRLLTVGE